MTVSEPVAPVLASTMPLAAPFAEMLRKVRPPAPMVAPDTFSAVPWSVVRVLSGAVPLALGSVTTTVPPVALNAVLPPVEAISPPSKRISEVALLPLTLTPEAVVGDQAVEVHRRRPVRLVTSTDRATGAER